MTFCGSLIVGATLLIASASPVASKSELDKLQGVWRAVAIKIEGRPVEPYELSKKGFGIELNVVGDRFHFVGIGADIEGQLKVENVGKSKRMVFIREDGRRTTSVYRWEDKVVEEQEAMMVVKTARDLFPALAKRVAEIHPYAVPEVVGLPLVEVVERYRLFLDDGVRREK